MPAVVIPIARVCKVQWETTLSLLIWELSLLTCGLAARSRLWEVQHVNVPVKMQSVDDLPIYYVLVTNYQ